MLKVLLCAPYGGIPGGITRWTEHIKQYYDSVENSEIDLCIVPMGRSMFVNTNVSMWFRLRSVWVDYRQILYNYYKQVNRFSPEVFHLTSSGSLSLFKDMIMLWYARKKGEKTIIHFHFGRIPELSKRRNWEWKMLCKVMLMTDKIVVIDNMSYKTLKLEGFNNIVYLPNPLSPRILQIMNKQGLVNRESRKIVYVGHVVKTKGVFELVEACLDIPDIHLVLIGRILDGLDRDLKQIALRKGSTNWVTFMGEQPYDKVVYEMRTATVFALPSYTEGFPNVILESMICECPIVATSVGAIPEMLANDIGVLVEPQTVIPLKNALQHLLDNPLQSIKMGKKAAERVINLYSMHVIWKQLINIWNSGK